MNFVARVEENLRDLGTEARRKHPGVKEASERAILTLRSCQSKYVAAVRRATSDATQVHPTTALFRSQDVLRPFLLAANYPDASARILSIALGGIELLLEGDAICEGDEKNIVRVLGIQAGMCCVSLGRDEMASMGHQGGIAGGVGAGVGAAGSAAAGAVGAVIGTGWGMFGGGGGSGNKHSDGHSIGGGSGAADDLAGLAGGSHSTHSARTVREDEDVARRILKILVTITMSPALGMTEEVLAQCLTVCLMLLSCGNAECASTDAAVDAILGNINSAAVGGSRVRAGSRSGQTDLGISQGTAVSSSSLDMDAKTPACRTRRAACSTLKKVILTLYERTSRALLVNQGSEEVTSDNRPPGTDGNIDLAVSPAANRSPQQPKECSDPKIVHSLAVGAFLDLCALASPSSDFDRKYQSNASASAGGTAGGASKWSCLKDTSGPLAIALESGGASMGHRQGRVHAPSRSTCMWILDSVLKERSDLFQPAQSNDQEITVDKILDDFPSLLQKKACPVISATLLGLCSDRIPLSRSDQLDAAPLSNPAKGRKEDAKAIVASSIPAPKDLAILMASTTLARRVIFQYGSAEDSSGEIHTLVTSLVRFVVAATESIRDTEGFEDGYIHDRAEDDIMSASWASRGNADLASGTISSGGAPTRPKRAQRGQSLDSQMTSSANDGNSWLLCSRQVPLPSTLLWGAALSLEVLHNLLLSSWPVMKDLLTSISEAASDFAVVGGSCTDSIRGVVAAAAKDSNRTPLAKLLVRAPCQEFSVRGKQLLSAFNEESDVISIGSKAATNTSRGSGEGSSDLVGDVVWIAYKCILLIAESLETCVTQSSSLHDSKQDLLVLIDGPFSPSLAAFQHFMKRLPGAKLIVARTVAGYSNMANALIPCASDTESIQRRALLTSLCKLSLPSWGDDEDGIPLEDHHVLCLEELFGIIHRHHNALKKDWYIVLCTLEYLSRSSISSPSLSEGALRKASFISSCLSRLSLFTTCLSEDSLQCFVSSLADISTSQSEKAFVRKKRALNVPLASSRSGEDNDPASQQKDSAGVTGRLFSLAGRAFGSASDPNLKGKRDSFDSSVPRARTSKTYDHDYRNAAYARLATTKASIQKSAFQELPFCLVAITDVALYNLFRYKDYGPAVGTHLQKLVLSPISSEVRLYAIDSLTNIVTAQVSHNQESRSTHSTTIRQDANTLKDFLAVQDRDSALDDSELQEEATVSQADLLSPLCDAVKGADKVDIAEAGLQGIYSVLEGAGHYLANDAWLPLIRCIGALSGNREEESRVDGGLRGKEGEHAIGTGNSVDRSVPVWSSCSTLGFRCLKLIVDDFLDEIPREAETRSALLECCAAYGSSQHDVNTSLTSLGMLWTIADQDLTPEALDRVLAKLSLLAFDGRVEVRNCAVNTLFSCVVGLGDSLSPIQWRVCLSETLLGVLEEISSRGSQSKNGGGGGGGGGDTKTASSGANPDAQSNRYKVTVHHSRDSSIKQWATTQVLALRGLERVLRQFFPQLLLAAVSTRKDEVDDVEGWLKDSWDRILDTAYRCAILTGGRDSLELRVVGTDLSVLCAQVSSKAGLAASNTPARVSTNMQVVNGALRSVNPSKKEQLDETNDKKVSDAEAAAAAQYRALLFRMAFDRVEELGLNLEHQSNHTDEEGSAIYVESTLLQVMTKFSGCLTALYECCKDNEMSPPTLATQREGGSNDLESKLAHVVGAIMKTAIGDPSSKYLNQAQRGCLELLRTMSLRGSFVAYEELGESAYCALNPPERADGGGGKESAASPSVASETLQVECSKVVLELFSNGSADSSTKLHVFDSILARSSEASIARYDLFIPIVLQGLGVIADTAEGREADDADDLDLEDLWKRILTILSALLVPSTADSIHSYASNADDILSITNHCAEKLPPKFSDDLCDVLALGAESAAKVARKETNFLPGKEKDANVETLRTNGLKIFQACFGALCSKQPNGSLLLSLSEQLLREAVDGAAQTASMKEHNRDDASVDVEVALFVCESIRKHPNIEQVAIKLFPWLCKLTRSDSAALRTEAGTVLSSVDMVRVIEEAKAAEERAAIAELKCEKLQAEVKKLRDENDELRHQAMMGI